MNFLIFGAILIILSAMVCESALDANQCGSPNCCRDGAKGVYAGLRCGNGIFDFQLWEIVTGIH